MGGIHHYFDLPSDWKSLPQCFLIRGWYYADDRSPIRGIRLLTHDASINGEIGKHRPDVKLALRDAPDDFTGFEIKGVLSSGRHNLQIEVQISNGNWQRIFAHSVKIQRRWLPLWLGGGNWVELTFHQFSCQRQHPPRSLSVERFPTIALDPARRPKLSIVTPSLQQAHFLTETLRGVLDHQPITIEYIVQDGGSSDHSVEVIRRFAAEDEPHRKAVESSTNTPSSPTPTTRRITAWASEPDAGQADAIVRGFAKTSGNPNDLMAWINSDDFYLPGALAFVANYFAQHPDVDVIYGHRILVDESSQEIGRWFLPPHDDEVLKRYDFVPQETMFWRRRIWNKAGGLDASLKFAMDWDLLLRFQAAGARIVRVPYFLACFRVHPAQKTSAQMETIGQREIDFLRARTFAREVPATEIEHDPVLLRYLRRSAWINFLWKLGIRQ